MDSWYKVELSREDIIAGKHLALMQEARALFMAYRDPNEAAIFTNTAPSIPVYYFFSPEAARLANSVVKRYAGVPCDPPSADERALSVGNTPTIGIPFADPRKSN